MEAETPISIFTTFISLRTGSARRAKVREAQDPYDPQHDFYRQLRTGAVASIVTRDPRHVSAAVERAHSSKVEQYRLCARGLEKWIKKTHYDQIDRPRPRRITIGDLQIQVNPEMTLRVHGTHHLVKFLTRQDPLTRDALNAYAYLLDLSHGAAHLVPALLDLRKGRILTPKPSRDTETIVESEAAAFVAMWRRLAA